MAKNRVVESMTKVVLGYWTVRIWYNEALDAPKAGPRTEIRDSLNRMYIHAMEKAPHRLAPEEVAQYLDSIPEVAAYEILDPSGNGVVVYPDWK